MTETVLWTPELLQQLRHVFTTAVEEGAEQFEFGGHTYLTDYAKYLIVYLTEKFE